MFGSRNPRNTGEDESGLVGIGTLVIFASIVIVSAVAAGVLINTSLSLQQQARATTKDTVSQVSSGINVLDAKGRTGTDALIENVDLIVRPYPGTSGINLENTVLQYKSQTSVRYLNYENTDNPNENQFTVFEIQDRSNTGATSLASMGDISGIHISLPQQAKLDQGDEASISIVPSSGFKTSYRLFAPPTLGESQWYIL